MSFARLWLALAVLLPVLAVLIAPVSTVDLTYHLRAGSEILAARAIPSADTWTYTAAGLPWIDQQWGAQVLLQGAWLVGGWTGLAVLRAALVAVTFGGLALVARNRGLDERTAAILSLAAFVVATPALALRPQLFGMALFVVTLYLITGRREHSRRLWLIPLLMVPWANLHGSFFLAPLVLGLAWLEDLHDRVARPHLPLAVAMVSVVAACITPFGPAIWLYAFGLSLSPEVTSLVGEWQPTSIRTFVGLVFFGSAMGIVALIARGGRRVPWPTLAWLAVFFLIGAYAQRGIAWWPLAAVAGIAGTIVLPAQQSARAPETRTIRRMNAMVVGVLVVAIVALLPVWRPVDERTGTPAGYVTHAPPGITAALRDLLLPSDRVFNPQIWGSWFEFELPNLPVAIDSRIEFFPPEIWTSYTKTRAGVDGWAEQLDAWGVTIVVTGPGPDDDARTRLSDGGWVEVYRDDDGGIFVRAARTTAMGRG